MTASEVVPAASGTDTPPGPLKWADEVDTDIEQDTGTGELQEMIVVPEPSRERTIIPRFELLHNTSTSRYSPVQCAEDTATRSDGEEDVTTDKNSTPVPREREKTTEDLRRNPKHNKKNESRKTRQAAPRTITQRA
jgi:hypothetical protein